MIQADGHGRDGQSRTFVGRACPRLALHMSRSHGVAPLMGRGKDQRPIWPGLALSPLGRWLGCGVTCFRRPETDDQTLAHRPIHTHGEPTQRPPITNLASL